MCAKTIAWFIPPPMPGTKTPTSCTSGFAPHDVAHGMRVVAPSTSNEMSCGPSMAPNRNPLSWLGMKPVGMVQNR